jgi:hypothetical protein
LNGVQALRADAFDRRDLTTLALHGQHEARTNEGAVHEERTGTTDAVLATDMRPGESKIFANEICQVLARTDAPGLFPSVDRQSYRPEEIRLLALVFSFTHAPSSPVPPPCRRA